MKIAIDIREASGPKVGKGWYTFVMVKELLKQDPHNHYILYTNESNPAFDKYENAKQRVIKKRGIRFHLSVLRDLMKVKPDLFWAPTSYIIPALAPRSLNVVITVHDIVAFLFPEGHNKKAVWAERLTLKRAVKKASHILTVSRNTKHDLMKVFHIPEEKILIAPCAASKIFKPVTDGDKILEVRAKYKLPKKFILAVGTLSPRKNFTRLIKAYAHVVPKHDDTHLVIVGPEGWNYGDLLQFKESDKVHFIGYVDGDDISTLYSLAKIFVFPSLYEGFGMPPLEAMASGCPVITSNVSSLPEVTGNAAMLIDPYSVEEISTAIDVILSNHYMALDMKEKGIERAKKFSWKDSAGKILEVFEAI
jgi:glycosyltransferase involved in cell wall biosynthesis